MKEDIIQQAKEKYPIGTRVNSLGGSENEEVIYHNFYWDGTFLRVHGDCALYDTHGKRWAKIVKVAPDPIINNYQIY